MRNKFIFALVAAVFVLVSVDSAFAQVSTRAGAIYGRVQDDKAAPLPGVNTTLECTSIGAPQTATTGPTGGFRFANIPPGVCSVTFSLEGFTEIRQEEVRVSIGGEVQLSITMRPTLEEEFVVVAETPVVDTRKLGNETTFTSEYLEQVPSGRDPWTMIEQTPGVDNDRINIAGSEGGQQTNFFARGDGFASNTWRYDGVTAEDNAALGATTYYDFDSFEEVQITSGGADASIGKSGVVVNIVTKRGGNKWEANVSGFYTSDDLQSDNTPDEVTVTPNPITGAPVVASNRIDQVYEYGFDLGGPIVKDKLFVWGSYRKNQIDLVTRVGLFDKTELISWNLKTNYNMNESNELQFSIWTNDKNKSGRTFDPGNQAEETTWNQGSPGTIFDKYPTIQHTWIPNDRTILTSRYGYFAISFGLEPSGGNQVPMIYLLDSGIWEETGFFVTPIDRPTHSINSDLNVFRENWAGGDHEFKFGFEYSHNKLSTFSSYGIGYLIYTYGTQPGTGGPIQDGFVKVQYAVDGHTKYQTASAYVTDTIRMDRLTLNLGARFDTQDGENDPSTLPAAPNFEAVLPPISYQGGPGTDRFSYVSPRLGATYDLTGDGKTIVRGNYALYYSGYGPGFDTFSNPTFTYIGATGITFTNLNGDRRLQPNELDFSGIQFYGGLTAGGFDEELFESRLTYDPDLKETPIHEFIAGFERELFKDFSFAANFTHRTYDGTIAAVATEADGSQVDVEDFIPQTPLQINNSLGSFTVPYSILAPGVNDGAAVLTNIDDYSQTYNGVDLIGRKRMSNNFMLNASVTLQKQKAHYDGGNSYFITTGEGLSGFVFADPTAVDTYDDQLYAFVSAGSGKAGIYPFSEWTARISGVYQLPWDMTAGGFIRYQQGQPRPLFTSVSDGAGLAQFYGSSTHLILVAPLDTFRYENIFTLDLNLRKTFEIGAAGRLTGSVDVFNVTNSNQVILRNVNARSALFGTVSENLSPRAVRLGLRYSF